MRTKLDKPLKKTVFIWSTSDFFDYELHITSITLNENITKFTLLLSKKVIISFDI